MSPAYRDSPSGDELPIGDEEMIDSVNAATEATEPKQSEEAPRESEAKFRLLFERSPNAMLLLDGDVFIDCNQAAVEMMRCSGKEQLLALHPYDISPERQPDGRLSVERARELIDMAHQEGSLRFEWVHRRMDGQDFPAEVLLTAIPLHGRQILHVSLGDITERKRAEKELREREAQYRGIFEASSDAVLIFDFEGTIVEANPAACRMYGYSYQELIGLCGKDIVHPDYYYLFEDYKRQVKVSGRFSAQSVDLCKDGSAINVEVHGASFSYKGRPHLLAVVRDVTEKAQARQMLEQRVKERTRELSTLLEVSRNVASTLELESLLGLILDQLKIVVDYDGAAVMTLEGEGLAIMAYRGPIPQEEALQVRFPLERTLVNREVIRRREPV
ncbi:MAG TPA: PAS domain S-box protein, partial [Anaerolineae bacterium]|nr:PAS domain S-box protein [Anaerolineae bacterium]